MKIICIVQARMGSERLPGKVMKDIMGKPMITYILDRLKRSRYVDEVILATSDKISEEPLVQYLTKRKYIVFRGDECNVLDRYAQAAKVYGGDVIIRVTGDCPLIDPVMLDHVITYYLSNEYDYVGVDTPNKNFIRGFDMEVFSKEALMKAYELTKRLDTGCPEKEHVTYFIYKHPELFSIYHMKASKLLHKNYRLCVDTPEDLELIRRIYEYFEDPYVTAKKVIAYLDENPAIAEINQEVIQRS